MWRLPEVDSTSFGESGMHKLAKRLLIEYLNKKNVCMSYSFCRDCNARIERRIPPLVYMEEKRFGSAVFDIVGMDNESIVFGIEICHTHKTREGTDRDKIPWVEFNASNVISKFNISCIRKDFPELEDPLSGFWLRNTRKETCCSTKKDKRVASLNIPSDIQGLSARTGPWLIECSSIYVKSKIYLNVPYEEKDKAKALGARWDKNAKKWYILLNDETQTHP